MIDALVFDFDGVILDTERPVFEAWRWTFERHGCELTLEEWSAEIGAIGAIDALALLRARAVSALDEVALNEARRAHLEALVAEERVRPGVIAWLDDAQERGIEVAIASSSSPEWVEGHLDRLGLRSRFVHVACAGSDGVLPPKPAPDLYLAACRELGVSPDGALAVEDSPPGVAAAKAAGLSCIAVPHGLTDTLDLSAADLRLPSLAACTLSDAIARISQSS